MPDNPENSEKPTPPPPVSTETPVLQEPVKVTGTASAIEALLRSPASLFFALSVRPGLAASLAGVALLCAAVFGLVIGTYSGGTQLWASPLKTVGGLAVSALICFPSLYIFACMSGFRRPVQLLVGAYVCGITLCGLVLLGFAPVLWVFTQSTNSLFFMGSLLVTTWLIAFFLGLNRLFQFLRENPNQTLLPLYLWLGMFLIVTLQMSTALRPVLGTPDSFLPTEKRFFLHHWVQVLKDGVYLD